MICHQIFALIKGYEIKKIQAYETYGIADQYAKNEFGPNAFAVECTRNNVSVGDKYVNGEFYTNQKGNDIVTEESYEENVLLTKRLAENLQQCIDQLIIDSL